MNSHRARSGYFCFSALSWRHFCSSHRARSGYFCFPALSWRHFCSSHRARSGYFCFPALSWWHFCSSHRTRSGYFCFPALSWRHFSPPIGRDPVISVFPPYPSSPQRPSGIMSPYSEAIRRKASVIGKIPSSEQQLLSRLEKGAHKLAALATKIRPQTTDQGQTIG